MTDSEGISDVCAISRPLHTAPDIYLLTTIRRNVHLLRIVDCYRVAA
jgi:hypothetical protein